MSVFERHIQPLYDYALRVKGPRIIATICPHFFMRTFMVCPRRDFPYKPSLFSTTEFLQRMSAFPLQYSPLAPLTTKKSTKAYESYVVTHTPNNRSRAIYPKM